MPDDDPLDFDWFRASAAHESAHATVTSALRISVRRILVVQLTGSFKLLYEGCTPKEDCSHSQPDPHQYREAGPAKRCTVARAGEVGQRIHLRAHAVLINDQWSADLDDIKRDSKLSGPDLEQFVNSLGSGIESWLKDGAPNRIWNRLTEALTERRKPHPADSRGFRAELAGDEVQEILNGTPEFPAELLPDLPGA